MTVWHDLAARARGLASHLLDESDLQRLATAPDAGRLGAALARTPYAPHLTAARPSPEGVEEAVRRRVARDLAVLGRWAGPDRRQALGIVFEEADRTSLRALARGAVAGLPSRIRLRGAIPTPALPLDRLRAAAEVPGLEALARSLESWAHPLAPVMAAEALRARPDLFRLEVALFEAWIGRVARAARKEGGLLRDFGEEAVDAWNVRTAAARAESPAGGGEVPFVEGGRWLTEEAFRAAAQADGPEETAARLDRALAHTPFRALGRGGASFEEDLLERRRTRVAQWTRIDPVGPGPVLVFALGLRREVRAIRRAGWGVALGAPEGDRAVRAEGAAGPPGREAALVEGSPS